MPLPLIPVILGGLALAGAGYGAKKAYDAYGDNKEAEKFHEDAKRLYDEKSSKLEKAYKKANEEFEKLGKAKFDAVNWSLKRYQVLMDILEIEYKSDINDSINEENLSKFISNKKSLVSLETALTGLVGSAASGAFAGFGAFGAAGLLGTASTGTAIGSLSGVAATNATLAWFGGGALAAGGFGMAGGMVVLGGIVVAPVIAVAAAVFASHMEGKKYDAQSYYYTVEALGKKMETQAMLWKKIENEAICKQEVIDELNKNLNNFVTKIESYAEALGTKVSEWKQEIKNQLLATNATAETLINTIKAPILNDNDENTKKIIDLQKESKQLMDEIQATWGEK